MALSPSYAQAPVILQVQIATANTNRDGTGTVGTVGTAGTNGTRIERIRIKATGSTTAGMVRLFLHDGTNYRLYAEVVVTVITAAAAVATFVEELVVTDLVLPPLWSLRASTHNAETFNVIAFGATF